MVTLSYRLTPHVTLLLCEYKNMCSVVLQAGLVVDWVKSKRLLVLVKCVKDQALFILTSQAYPVTKQQDLAIDTAIPIDNGFK